jgi:hypothetical protein
MPACRYALAITASDKKRTDYIFFGRRDRSRPMTARQLSRLLRLWVSDAGLNPKKYGVESLRRTKAAPSIAL